MKKTKKIQKQISKKILNKGKKKSITKFSFDKKMLLFFLKFFGIFIILSIMIPFLDFSFLENFITFISASYLGLLFNGNMIFVNGTTFIVTSSCTGLVSASILASLIFSLKKPAIKEKLFLFIFGLCFLLVVNIPRVMLVLLSAKIGFDVEIVHPLTWFLMSAIVILIWYYGNKSLGIKNFNKML